MRWPLRYQIMLPMTLVLLTTITAMSLLNAYLAAQQTTDDVRQRLQDVAQTLATSSIPMTDGVLKQMKGLAGADFVLVRADGEVAATSRADWDDVPLGGYNNDGDDATKFQFVSPLQIEGQSYQHALLAVPSSSQSPEPRTLHLFYPNQAYRHLWWQAVQMPLLTGAAALLVIFVLALWIANRVGRPLQTLQSQVERIAEGEFAPVPLPATNDEVQDLATSVNRMAVMLAQYEDNVRRSERLRTLGQLGGGLAHQLRNSATGARMGLDIHRAECPLTDDNESLDVANRQLVLLEKYLQKFLSLGSNESRPFEPLSFAALVERLVPLVGPAAKHVGVELETSLCSESLIVEGEADGLEHLVLNLLLNAIDAAAASTSPHARAANVHVNLRRRDQHVAEFIVSDSGAGPSEEIIDKMFEPLVSDKPEGAGLGLAVVQDVVTKHRGEVVCQRLDGATQFVVTLPLVPDPQDVSSAEQAESDCV